MEVHHHAHTARKKWTHYFWEFLMLFLAVFCGFLAEYQLEHKIEHDREIVLAQSLYEDLKKDNASLTAAIELSNRKMSDAENLLLMLHMPKNSWNDTTIYKSITLMFSTFPFATTDGTYQQMKASGSLRYFKQSLVNLMNSYDNQTKKTVFRDQTEEKALWELVPFAATIINFEVTGDLRFNKPITHEMYVKIKDKDMLDVFINKIVTVRTMRGRSLQEYEIQFKKLTELMEALENKYHLK
jgi:hypothetical protein